VLRRLLEEGDDLSQTRMVDFCHIFLERRQALAFAEIVDDKELRVCISYYEGRAMWQVIVKRFMIPTHQDVTAFELSLAAQAELVGGTADGWGCMAVNSKTAGSN